MPIFQMSLTSHSSTATKKNDTGDVMNNKFITISSSLWLLQHAISVPSIKMSCATLVHVF